MQTRNGLALLPLGDCSRFASDAPKLRSLAAGHGYLYFRGLLAREPVLRLRSVVLEYAREVGWTDGQDLDGEGCSAAGVRVGDYEDPDWIQMQVRVHTRPEFKELGEQPAIRQVLDAVLGSSFLTSSNICRVVSPDPALATRPHQDAHFVRTIETFWTAWIPLGDCPMALGPLAVLDGSHQGGLRAHEREGLAEQPTEENAPDGTRSGGPAGAWSTTDFECGDALLFSQYTVHRSLPNLSRGRLRLSADFRYSSR